MGRLGSALLALGLLSGALAKPKVGFNSFGPIFKLFLQNSGDVEFSAKKTNDSLDIPLFFTPLVFTPCTWLIKSLPLPQPAFGQTETSSLAQNCHLDIVSFLHQK